MKYWKNLTSSSISQEIRYETLSGQLFCYRCYAPTIFYVSSSFSFPPRRRVNRRRPGGPMVIVLASGSEVREFKPGRGRGIFSERKNPEYEFLRKGSNAMGPVSQIYVKEHQAEIRASQQNLSDFSRSL